MTILVTGGTGYIGSHTCVTLLNAGYDVIIADNLSNSKIETLDKIKELTGKTPVFYQIDVADRTSLKDVFLNHTFSGVIHFAGLKAVGESVEKPLMYYYNNLVSTMALTALCVEYGVNKIIFSSSATVYGDNVVPFEETMQLLPTTNPYGESKAISERILRDAIKAHPQLSVAILRYFNPVGAHESGLLGEAPNGIPNNLMPYITKVAKGELKQLRIFGSDYPTIDGTGVRDYVHVVDLAEGHVAALENLSEGMHLFNLGTGEGTSVLQLVRAFEQATGISIPYEITARRPGDIATCYADVSKANSQLKWTAKRDITLMCMDAWRFESQFKDFR